MQVLTQERIKLTDADFADYVESEMALGCAVGAVMAVMREFADFSGEVPRDRLRGLREVQWHLGLAKFRHEDKRLDTVVEFARDNLIGDRQLLDKARDHVLSHRLSKWQVRIYDVLYETARDEGPHGGPNVLMPHERLRALCKGRYGAKPSLSTVTAARVQLIALGLLDATVGESWKATKERLGEGEKFQGKATIYHLLPDSLREALAEPEFPKPNTPSVRPLGVFGLQDDQPQMPECECSEFKFSEFGECFGCQLIRDFAEDESRITVEDSTTDNGEDTAVVSELTERIDHLETEYARHIARLTAEIDGLQAQVAALTAREDDDMEWLR